MLTSFSAKNSINHSELYVKYGWENQKGIACYFQSYLYLKTDGVDWEQSLRWNAKITNMNSDPNDWRTFDVNYHIVCSFVCPSLQYPILKLFQVFLIINNIFLLRIEKQSIWFAWLSNTKFRHSDNINLVFFFRLCSHQRSSEKTLLVDAMHIFASLCVL